MPAPAPDFFPSGSGSLVFFSSGSGSKKPKTPGSGSPALKKSLVTWRQHSKDMQNLQSLPFPPLSTHSSPFLPLNQWTGGGTDGRNVILYNFVSLEPSLQDRRDVHVQDRQARSRQGSHGRHRHFHRLIMPPPPIFFYIIFF